MLKTPQPILLDGAMGTMLQNAGLKPGDIPELLNLTQPDLLVDIHQTYIQAGAQVLYTNTFGCNAFKLQGTDIKVEDVIDSAVSNAKKAAQGTSTRVALDVGPLGELLKPMGTLTFEKAYDTFAQIMIQGAASGADLVVIETMTDLYEVKAAVLAAKEHTDLPVWVSMSFEDKGRTFTGTSIDTMAATLTGLGVDAIGINCSLGPLEILPLAQKLRARTPLPLFVKANAGLPDPLTNTYSIGPEDFAQAMAPYLDLGIYAMGGCCGTRPETIAALKKLIDSHPLAQPDLALPGSVVTSATKTVDINQVTVIGERINPTGKKRLKQALIDEDFDYILGQAIEQVEAGAPILDVNVGVPEVDEPTLLPKVIKALQAVVDVPLQIDSSDPKAIEAALRVYNGKPIVNSVNGEEASMAAILPLVKKYGAAVIGLTLDEGGIPNKAQDRFAIAARILDRAISLGIPKEDVFIDCLALTASAQQAEVAETLEAIHLVKTKLGLKTALGVSNISFGLPARPLINRTFLALAMENGLDLPIINPNDEDMMGTIYAYELLINRDRNAVAYIERYKDIHLGQATRSQTVSDQGGRESVSDLYASLEKGLKAETRRLVQDKLQSQDPMSIINDDLIPALDRIGQGFEKGTLFLPQMMQAATAAQAGFDVIKDHLASSGETQVSKGKIILATVKGDIHDIGKNIVKVILENYGYDIIDLGRDVPVEDVVQAAQTQNVKLVGLSALMTTTLKSMEDTIQALKAANPTIQTMVGGAVLTPDYAKTIGADYYCKDAMKSVEAARKVLGA